MQQTTTTLPRAQQFKFVIASTKFLSTDSKFEDFWRSDYEKWKLSDYRDVSEPTSSSSHNSSIGLLLHSS